MFFLLHRYAFFSNEHDVRVSVVYYKEELHTKTVDIEPFAARCRSTFKYFQYFRFLNVGLQQAEKF
ncbi:hypothetical protein GSUB_05535 [Geoalkalibacter subterraneus]|uniref:Uncharacterized protein n=1 Tax=Geoalkalibacter subterraneus TaxID=483547 RepID=A0A0B5FPZ6_9BACT|nr:hypothetical protein GSUB_05535 [Geoalkalibacter subterraneus]